MAVGPIEALKLLRSQPCDAHHLVVRRLIRLLLLEPFHNRRSPRARSMPVLRNCPCMVKGRLLSLCRMKAGVRFQAPGFSHRAQLKIMRFSRRTNWNTEESELARAHRMRRDMGLPIADLTASNPTRCGFEYPSGLLNALTDPRALDYDPQSRGLLPARRRCVPTTRGMMFASLPEQVVLTTSTSEAYSYLFRLLCDPGGEIVVPQPGYPLFDFLVGLDDVRLRPAPLVYDHGWQIEPEGFRRIITPDTRAIVLVHPNNPTGHFTRRWEADELVRLCREFDLSLIVDEVFLDYFLRDVPADAVRSFAAGLDGIPVFVVSGLSKIAALPQMKAAWIVATGPDQPGALDRLEVIADTFLSMNAPVQWALLNGFQGGIQWAARFGNAFHPTWLNLIEPCHNSRSSAVWTLMAAGMQLFGFRRSSRMKPPCASCSNRASGYTRDTSSACPKRAGW